MGTRKEARKKYERAKKRMQHPKNLTSGPAVTNLIGRRREYLDSVMDEAEMGSRRKKKKRD